MDYKRSNTRIALFGGGRWARVLLSILLDNTKNSVLFTVHTKYFIKDMQNWINKLNLQNRVSVSTSKPNFQDDYVGTIVANAAKDHKKIAELSLISKVPVFVEKPLTTSHQDTLSLIDTAKKNNTLLFPSLVFLYASYIDNFINDLGDIKKIKEVRFNWMDEPAEYRYGEIKSFDPATPVFTDVLPHILSILSKIFNSNDFEYNDCKVDRGGAFLHITIHVSNVKCILTLERNSAKRKREIFIKSDKDFALDFSVEPGSISINKKRSCGDLNWNLIESPLTKMINTFLSHMTTKKAHQSFNNELSISVSNIIKKIEPEYKTSLQEWLISHLNQNEIVKNDINYFLQEFLLRFTESSYEKTKAVKPQYLKAICSKDFINKINLNAKSDYVFEYISSLDIS